MFIAYFDESYNHYSERRPNDPLLYTVGCCLSTKAEWLKFGVRWKSALKRKPKIDFFHMTDFESRKRDYAEWTDVIRLERLQRFHQIMKDHIIFTASTTVHCRDFDEVFIHDKLKQMDYYSFGSIVCMDSVSSWCDKHNYNQPIHYVFAHLEKQGGWLDEWFNDSLNEPDSKAKYRLNGMWSKGLMKDVPQLQAADIVAYEMNKRCVNEMSDGNKVIRKSLDNLEFGDDNCTSLYYGRKQIIDVINDIGFELLKSE